jgi:hypothetical protein
MIADIGLVSPARDAELSPADLDRVPNQWTVVFSLWTPRH